MIRAVLLLAFTSLIISMFFLVGFDEGWNVALRKLLGTAVVIVGAIILIMPPSSRGKARTSPGKS